METRGVDVVAAGLHELIVCVQRAAEDNGVTFLGTDIDHDGGKVILVAGAPNATGEDEGRMLLRFGRSSTRRRPFRCGSG